jgi:hypothetical protein
MVEGEFAFGRRTDVQFFAMDSTREVTVELSAMMWRTVPGAFGSLKEEDADCKVAIVRAPPGRVLLLGSPY